MNELQSGMFYSSVERAEVCIHSFISSSLKLVYVNTFLSYAPVGWNYQSTHGLNSHYLYLIISLIWNLSAVFMYHEILNVYDYKSRVKHMNGDWSEAALSQLEGFP